MDLHEHIKQHALADLPNEACGFVLEESGVLVGVSAKNVSDRPKETFVIDPREYLEITRVRKLKGYYHSHPKGDQQPSEADRAVAERIGLPCYIYSVLTDQMSVYQPNGAEIPLEGRSFLLGIFDCAGLIIDYYRQRLNIRLTEFERNYDRIEAGFEHLREYAAQNNLVYVSAPLQEHDIIMMRIGKPTYPNHCGIALAGDRMLHQLLRTQSAITVYGGYWDRNTAHVLRHQSLLC